MVKTRISKWRFRLSVGIVPGLAASLLPAALYCQTPRLPVQDFQGWASIEASHPINERTDLLIGSELRYSDDLGHSVYRRITGGVAFRLHKYFTFEPYYQYSVTDVAAGRFSHENRLAVAATAGGSWKGWHFSDRNTGERRFVEERRIWRYRNRVEVRRPVNVARTQLTLFAWDEVYYGTDAQRWYRNRAALGAGKRLSNRVSIDVFYVRQNDGFSRPGDLNALGISFKTRF